MTVKVTYNNQLYTLPLLVVEGEGPALFGHDWFAHIRLDWARIAHVSPSPELQQLLEQHAALFKEELGTVTGKRISLRIKEGAQPKFFRPRQVPLVIKGAIGKELERWSPVAS